MLNVLDWFRKRSPVGRKAAELYGSIVAQARSPGLFRDLGVPDTPNGRYEMIVIHTAVALAALSRPEHEDGSGPLGRALVEQFVTDMDDSLRQLAVGDMSVPKKVKRAAAGLKERTAEYRRATESSDPHAAMTAAVTTHVWPAGLTDNADPAALAGYVLDAYADARVEDGTLRGIRPVADLGRAAGATKEG